MALIAPELYDRLVALRRELHQYPELSGQEARTAAVISRFLHDCGIHHRTNIAGHGVVADIPGKTGVPCVVLRADTDALPIQEETGLEFASVHDAVMHACVWARWTDDDVTRLVPSTPVKLAAKSLCCRPGLTLPRRWQ